MDSQAQGTGIRLEQEKADHMRARRQSRMVPVLHHMKPLVAGRAAVEVVHILRNLDWELEDIGRLRLAGPLAQHLPPHRIRMLDQRNVSSSSPQRVGRSSSLVLAMRRLGHRVDDHIVGPLVGCHSAAQLEDSLAEVTPSARLRW